MCLYFQKSSDMLNLNKNTLGVKKVRGQSEAALQIGIYVRSKTLISFEAKKLATYQKSFSLLE